ncbi:MAG: hypothetical protein HN411_06530 [Waddliaceae bacterium]|jgi:flagellar motor switch protein FliN|nr:hypothetical protein [Waddliaceae bacterium]MBT3578463.1 hypothetical protein [Waddliaceae bacterium]MBT4445088.1 hypothetical protein [Waddliaceae bacterium]MBT6927891.1 hypothetical protein [Waddliaceae bacterium]MBT7264833.1 hypothetical protein [Waddliaceae bacterium]
MTSEPLYVRLEQVEQTLLQRDEIPLFGETPKFLWDSFATQLSRSLQIDNFSITQQKAEWRSAQTITEGFADDAKPLHIIFSPLQGSVCWLMNDADITNLMTELLFKDTTKKVFDENAEFKKGFLRFITLEVLNTFSTIKFAEELTPVISAEEGVPQEDAYCIDVAITLGQQKALGRVVITTPFREAWKKQFSPKKPTAIPQDIARKMDVVLHIEAGSTTMTLHQWQEASVGDCILLDSCSLDPGGERDTVTLTFDGRPFYRAKVTPKGIEIQETATFAGKVS